MKKKIFVALSLLLCFTLLFTACGKDEKAGIKDQVEESREDDRDDERPEKPTKPHRDDEDEEEEEEEEEIVFDSDFEATEDDWILFYDLKACFFPDYAFNGYDLWYGQFDDHGRISTAYYILCAWDMMGLDVSELDSNTLAQEMNNFYDEDGSYSIWDTACAVVGLDYSYLADFYLAMQDLDYGVPYSFYDVDGDVWYFDGETDLFIGSGDEYYIGDDGNYYEYVQPTFYYDEDGDIWYGVGDEYDEFVGYGSDCYIGDDGEVYVYDEDDYGSDPFFYSDDSGVVWYWNGETTEFIGTSEEYYVDEEGNIRKTDPPVQENVPREFYWADKNENVWFWNGDDNDFIGTSDQCYVDEAGLHWYGGGSSDYDDYGFFYYDEDGDLWYWNGEYDEYYG